jgi:hypothetical protein
VSASRSHACPALHGRDRSRSRMDTCMQYYAKCMAQHTENNAAVLPAISAGARTMLMPSHASCTSSSPAQQHQRSAPVNMHTSRVAWPCHAIHVTAKVSPARRFTPSACPRPCLHAHMQWPTCCQGPHSDVPQGPGPEARQGSSGCCGGSGGSQGRSRQQWRCRRARPSPAGPEGLY